MGPVGRLVGVNFGAHFRTGSGAPSGARLAILAAASGLSLGASGCQAADTDSGQEVAQHVVLVVIDTLRADALGCYGATGLAEADGVRRSPTPVLDELAERGMRFASVESNSSWTVTSAVSYLSGWTPLEHGVNSKMIRSIPDDVPLLPVALDEAGFETAAFVCNPMLGPKLGFDRGFDTFQRDKKAPGSVAVDQALRWATERIARPEGASGGSERLFLYVHLFDPHWPYEPAGEEAERFQLPESPLSLDEQVTASMGLLAGSVRATNELLGWVPWCQDAYSACVTTADRETGRLLSGLDELGILDDSLLIVTSDHGEEFGEHGAIGHAKQLYAESLRVPLIISGPGIPRGAVAHEPCDLKHLAGTVVSQLGIFGDSPIRGRDLLDAEDRREGALESHVAAVQHGILPKAGGGFRSVLQLMSLRRGNARVIVGFEAEFDRGETWTVQLDGSGYSARSQSADLQDVEQRAAAPFVVSLFEELKGRAENARSGTTLDDSAREERRLQLRELGYFGAAADENANDHEKD